MNDDQFCCNGQCRQGRECPRYQDQPMTFGEKFTLVIGLLGWVLIVCALLGYLSGNWERV